MRIGLPTHLISGIMAVLCLVLWTGCGGAAERLDRRDERDPFIIRGDARKRAGDVDGAIALYHQALERKPHLAMAHLRLAVEYDENKKDYLRAIHHYYRYIELRPPAQKRQMVEELIRIARVSYVASLPNPPAGALEKIAGMERERTRLKQQIEELSDRLKTAEMKLAEARAQQQNAGTARVDAAEPTGRGSVVPPSTPTAPRTGARSDSYQVQRGDTLSGIAGKVYNDPNQWNKIFDANRNVLPSPASIREGQTLIIPR